MASNWRMPSSKINAFGFKTMFATMRGLGATTTIQLYLVYTLVFILDVNTNLYYFPFGNLVTIVLYVSTHCPMDY